MVKKGKYGGFQQYVDEAFDYLKESMGYIWFVFGLFVFAGLVGFFFSENFLFLEAILRNLIGQIAGLDDFQLIYFIFKNNTLNAFYGLALGVIFGFIPIINAVLNGLVLGFVMKGVYMATGFADFWRLLPHGIFELPAIFISLGLGVKLGTFMFVKKGKWEELGRRFRNSLVIFFLVVLPLLVIAAVVEGLAITIYSAG